MTRLFALMGSGETTPTMTATHRAIFERLSPPTAVMLDTPFGFQENADVLSAKTCEYFQSALSRTLQVASFRRALDCPPLELETALAAIRGANLVFAGPGSPSYAVRQWQDSPIPDALLDKLQTGGAVVLASAAACSAGALTAPVYEIYKVGLDPFWLPGLNLLGRLGLPAVVLPHYNNTEGGNHDTRFCYLGERRLHIMESQMDPELFILGLDEHTCCLLDLDAQTFTVSGKGCVTIRRNGRSTTYEPGTTSPLQRMLNESTPSNGTARSAPAVIEPCVSSLVEQVERLEEIFAQALDGRNTSRALEAALGLEQASADWGQDCDPVSQQKARSVLRSMLVRLGEAAREGLVDPNTRVAPFVDTLLSLREEMRTNQEWRRADMIRDRLMAAGLEIHDTPVGTQWRLREPSLQ